MDGFYTITVSGMLTFQQDLIYSKIVSHTVLQKQSLELLDDDIDVKKISGDFLILRKEIINGILTSDILEALRKICTTSEIKEIYALEVVTAILYKKSLLITDKKEFISKMKENINNKNQEYSASIQGVDDARPRFWTYVDLNGLIDPLITQRTECKRLMKECTDKDSDDYKLNESLQSLYKSVANTFYGSLASIHFQISNVVLANNITARARVPMYIVKTVTLATQTVTDGCIYTPHKTLSIKNNDGKLPGLETLSNRTKLLKHRNIKVEPLGKEQGYDWKKLFTIRKEELLELASDGTIDKLFNKKVQDFMAAYGLTFKF